MLDARSLTQGCEWGVFEELANSSPTLLASVDQLLVEVHASAAAGSREGKSGASMPFRIEQIVTFVDHVFGRHGFRVASRHLNPWSIGLNDTYSQLLPPQLQHSGGTSFACWELVLLRPFPATGDRAPPD